METVTEEPQKNVLSQALESIANDDTVALRSQLAELHAAEIANLLESLPREQRSVLWNAVAPELEGDILPYLREEARVSIIDEMDPEEIVAAAEQMEAEDLAEVMDSLPDDIGEQVLQSLDEDHRRRLDSSLSFPEDSAGRLMSQDVISVRKNVTLAVVQRYLRHHAPLPSHTDAIMVIDDDGRYLGKLSLADVLTQNPGTLVETAMQSRADWVLATATEHDVAALFERRDLISVAVLDDKDQLLGRLTVDDVVDIIREEADRAYLQRAGLDEDEDLFAPVLPSAKRRAVWLGINLATVFLAAWVIGRFEEALDKLVALAVLMPIVASMGGIAGSQTLTLTIRGQALGQIAAANIRWLVSKEMAVGALNGLCWAAAVAVVTQLWFDDWGISMVIGTAMVINLLAAALSGVIIPIVLKRLGIDPALSGAVVLTTVTDVVGFMSFLGLATWFLL
jgi:magnesium transporter